jgi:putative transposase
MTRRRFELTDKEWTILKPMLPNKPRGVPRVDDRRVINGILWRFRTGSPWSAPRKVVLHEVWFSNRPEDRRMAGKRHKPEEIVAKLRQVDVLISQGRSVSESIRSIGVTEVTYYRWRSEFGGLRGDQVKRLKELEAENARLRRAVSDLTLDKMILAEAAKGNF